MNSFLSYLGGKFRLTKTILPLIPEHHCYCEVFAGASWLLFKKEPSRVEIINDINRELVTLYRVVQNHPEEFMRHMRWLLVARNEFEKFKATHPDTLTDIQRAVRFFYILKTAFGSKTRSPSFGTSTRCAPRLNLLGIEQVLSDVYLRLTRVSIENRPYERIIEQYDSPDTFFYLDPPYFGHEDAYGKDIFCRDDFTRIAALLRDMKGRFVLSLNDHAELRDVFGDFNIREVCTDYSVGKSAIKRANELLVRNY